MFFATIRHFTYLNAYFQPLKARLHLAKCFMKIFGLLIHISFKAADVMLHWRFFDVQLCILHVSTNRSADRVIVDW